MLEQIARANVVNRMVVPGPGLVEIDAVFARQVSRVHMREAGQAIGETGDTGMTGENTLYFELRQGAEPLDPLQWLARR